MSEELLVSEKEDLDDEYYRRCRKELLRGCVPIQIELALNDSLSSVPFEPLHLLASRYSFITLAAREIITFCKSQAIDFDVGIWFEGDGKALKSNLPIGVLYDCCNSDSKQIPWRITIHIQQSQYGEDSSSVDPRNPFFHSLKQALYLLYGTTRHYNEISLEEQKLLGHCCGYGVKDPNALEQVLGKLRPSTIDEAKLLPIRVIDRTTRLMSQRPCKAGSRTLGKVLEEDFHLSAECISAVTIQGIAISIDVDIFTVWRLMSHLDLFLYICIN